MFEKSLDIRFYFMMVFLIFNFLLEPVGYARVHLKDDGCSGNYNFEEDYYTGYTTCNDKEIKQLVVWGDLNIVQTKVNEFVFVAGFMTATNHSRIKRIDVDNDRVFKTVTLKDHSVVQGNLQFYGNPGVVYLDDTSKIEGEVINGEVEKL